MHIRVAKEKLINMTDEEIDRMPAGREIDELIATLMGFNNPPGMLDLPRFSTKKEEALRVSQWAHKVGQEAGITFELSAFATSEELAICLLALKIARDAERLKKTYTADELRAMADDDLCELAAVRVMKWKLTQGGYYARNEGDKPYYVPCSNYRFILDDGAAFSLLDYITSTRKNTYWSVSRSATTAKFYVKLALSGTPTSWQVIGDDRGRAITEACILAAQEADDEQ